MDKIKVVVETSKAIYWEDRQQFSVIFTLKIMNTDTLPSVCAAPRRLLGKLLVVGDWGEPRRSPTQQWIEEEEGIVADNINALQQKIEKKINETIETLHEIINSNREKEAEAEKVEKIIREYYL